MFPQLTLRFLGPPQILVCDRPMMPRRRTVTALLAYLALNRARQTREYLSSLFWSEYNQVKAFASLRHTLWEVQATLGRGWIVSDRTTVGLHPGVDISLDVICFQEALQAARLQGNLTLRAAQLADTVALYRNHFLAGFSLRESPEFNEWVYAQSEALRCDLATALTLLIEAQLTLRQPESAIPHARRLIALDPLNESAHRQLMAAYFQAGQHSAALKQYQTCEQTLHQELSLEPQPETLELYRQIRRDRKRFVWAEKPGGPVPPQHNLPVLFTSFIGRAKERDEVCALLNKHRLVTLRGAGGIGKTRLALQAGEKLLPAYPDGVWFVGLESVNDPALIPQSVAEVFGLRNLAHKTVLKRLAEALQARQTLLILDNCEHLLEAVAESIGTLLKHCPKLTILATGREMLAMDGEAVYNVPPLALPQEHGTEQVEACESLQLFSERAAQAMHTFTLNQENAAPVAGICQLVDGIPLAIELASAHVDTLTPAEILEQLQKSFALLTHRGRASVARHQSMRASLDWSWRLLTRLEQVLLARLSIFSGGWILEAAEQICADAEIAIESIGKLTASLVKKSLIVVEQVERRATRYRLHEIVRQYAHEKLVDESRFRTCHLQYYLQLSAGIETDLRGPQPGACLDLIHRERGNLFAALAWSLSQDVESGLNLASNLRTYWEMMDIFGGENWLAQLLEKEASHHFPRARARALCTGTPLLALMVKPELATAYAAEALRIYKELGDPLGEIDGLLSMGLATNKGEYTQTALKKSQEIGDKWLQARAYEGLAWGGGKRENRRWYLEKAVTLLQEIRNINRLAGLLIELAATDYSEGRHELALEEFEQCIETGRSLAAEYLKTDDLRTIFARATIALILGDYEQSRAGYEACARVIEKVGDRYDGSWLRARAGHAAVLQGDLPAARSIFTEVAPKFFAINSQNGLAFTLEGMAGLCVRTGDYERAARLIGFADAARQRTADIRPQGEQADVDRLISACLLRIGEEAFSDTYDEGQRMTMDEALRTVSPEN